MALMRAETCLNECLINSPFIFSKEIPIRYLMTLVFLNEHLFKSQACIIYSIKGLQRLTSSTH